MRLDLYLVENRLAESRQKAKYLIEQGKVLVNGTPCEKTSRQIDGQTVTLCGEGPRYVGRGGYKLEGAVREFALADFLRDKTAVDLGASTGGFTQCLLLHGAKRVYAVENGSGQLHPLLREDPRVISMEHCSARDLTPSTLPEKCGVAVMDLSFISQTLIYPVIPAVLEEGGLLLSLVKPQFEAGRGEIGKKGIVKDRKIHLRVLERLSREAYENRLYQLGAAVSQIPGGDGNVEYFFLFRLGGEPLVPFSGRELREVTQGGAVLRRTGEKGSAARQDGDGAAPEKGNMIV